uniref:Uncharacterized protein n=1 Tax=Panagrolaimus superbus TaxID=310955 RepID=A0A914YIB2_9BILA
MGLSTGVHRRRRGDRPAVAVPQPAGQARPRQRYPGTADRTGTGDRAARLIAHFSLRLRFRRGLRRALGTELSKYHARHCQQAATQHPSAE